MGDREKVIEISKQNIEGYDPSGFLGKLKCFDEVERMIRNGDTTRDIVTFIHGQNELTHMSRQGLYHAVLKYKKGFFGDRIETKRSGDDLVLEDPVKLAHILQEQFLAMNDRIKMETETEMSIRKLLPTTVREYVASAKLGQQLLAVYERLNMVGEGGGSGSLVRAGGSREDSSFHGPVDVETVMSKAESRHKVLGVFDFIAKNPGVFDSVVDGGEKKKRTRSKKKKAKDEDKAAS